MTCESSIFARANSIEKYCGEVEVHKTRIELVAVCHCAGQNSEWTIGAFAVQLN